MFCQTGKAGKAEDACFSNLDFVVETGAHQFNGTYGAPYQERIAALCRYALGDW